MEFWNHILQLPNRCLLNKKITKAFFKRNFELTVAERSLLDKQIESIDWFASLSPENTNISTYSNPEVSYEEVQIILANISVGNLESEHAKVAELIHKHIPYAIFLCVYNSEQMVWSSFNKRVNQKDASKRIIDKRHFTELISLNDHSEIQQLFLNSLAFNQLDKTNFYQLYNNYTECIFALQASALNSKFLLRTQSRTETDMLLLERIALLQQEIESLGITAKKETQLNWQVSLNLQIQNKRSEMAQLKLKIVE